MPASLSRGMEVLVRTSLGGRCHCGNIALVFETEQSAGDLQVRACQCSFCRSHGARNVTDPNGLLRITVQDASRLNRYRFGLGTADFWICAACGVYVAAVSRVEGADYATININCLEARDRFASGAAAVSYEGEDPTTRLARRKARWTPAVVDVEPVSPR